MSSRLRRGLVGALSLLALLLLVSTIPGLKLDLSRSHSDFQSRGSTSYAGGPIARRPVGVLVTGDADLAARVRDAIAKKPGFQLTRDAGAPSPAPLLRIAVRPDSGFWTPALADYREEVELTLASDGDLSQADSAVNYLPERWRGELARGKYLLTFHRRSVGFLSRAAARDRLAEEIATGATQVFTTAMRW